MARVNVNVPGAVANRFPEYTVTAWYDDTNPDLIFAKAVLNSTGQRWTQAGCNIDDDQKRHGNGLREALSRLANQVLGDIVPEEDLFILEPQARINGMRATDPEATYEYKINGRN